MKPRAKRVPDRYRAMPRHVPEEPIRGTLHRRSLFRWLMTVAIAGTPARPALACSGQVLVPYENAGDAPRDIPTIARIDAHLTPSGAGRPGLRGLTLNMHSVSPVSLAKFGLSIRLLEGDLPFPIPTYPVQIFGEHVMQTWPAGLSPARPAFRARLELALIGPDGGRGPNYEVVVSDPGRMTYLVWLGNFFWPAAIALAMVTALALRWGYRRFGRRRHHEGT